MYRSHGLTLGPKISCSVPRPVVEAETTRATEECALGGQGVRLCRCSAEHLVFLAHTIDDDYILMLMQDTGDNTKREPDGADDEGSPSEGDSEAAEGGSGQGTARDGSSAVGARSKEQYMGRNEGRMQ